MDRHSSPEALPDWLGLRPLGPPPLTKEGFELKIARYEMIFPSIIDLMSEGSTLSNALAEYPYDINRGDFRRWVKRDPERMNLLSEAESLLADCLFDDFVDHTRAIGDNLVDVEAAKLRSANLKWLLGIYNKKRFGDIKTVDITSVSVIGALLAAADNRVRRITAEVRDVVCEELMICECEEVVE